MEKFIAIAVIAVLIFIMPLFTQWLWSLIVPDIFPGLVENGMVSDKISYWPAFFISFLTGAIGFGGKSSKK